MQKVLIIDANQEETELLKAVLEEEYNITAVDNVAEGFAFAETGKYSLIFLDMSLDDEDELRLLKELQGRIVAWHIPVILLMDQADVKKEEHGLALGAADYIVRPVYPLVVKARANTHISLYQYKKKEEKGLSMVDPLTGVASRQRYELNSILKWQEAVRLGVPVSVGMFDIDRFRTYNERYGYPAGDQVLASVAEVVSSCLRRSTDLFARYEADKFVLIILGGARNVVFEYMKKIRQAIEKLHIPHWDSASGWVSVSISGVTVIPKRGDSYDTYFGIMENMMSEAKKSGGDQVVWMNEETEQLNGK